MSSIAASQMDALQSIVNTLLQEGKTPSEISNTVTGLLLQTGFAASQKIELEEGIFVHPEISAKLKEHQVDGVKFMYKAIIKSKNDLNTDDVGGGILNHCMGLGKTFSVIAFLDTICRNAPINRIFKKIILVCPVGVIHTWTDELNKWKPSTGLSFTYTTLEGGSMELFFKNWNRPSVTATPKVLLIGYEKFRTLVNKGINSEFYRGLVYPGPDLLVCDESHRLKNEDMNLYKALEPVNTKRRLFLTGTLFQNDLFEYRCCVNFVQPILFSRNAFEALFKYPIENGSTIDMHENAVGESRRRAHVLYRLVEPHVHRRGHVKGVLPERKDFVVFIRLSDTQCGLYKGYLDYLMEPAGEPRAKKAKRGYFLNYHFLRKIWTHPRLLLAFENKLEENADFKLTEVLSHFRADGLLHDVQSRAINLSGKLTFVLSLIAECVKERQNDKILIFTQFIESIVLLKEALSESLQWCEGEEFFVISGEIPPMDRKQIESMFNDKNGVVKLVIFSTRAGCVGTNFQAANRVVIFDVSANPAIDEQATYRAYRIGQQKPVFVYRLVVEQTLEDRDYRRQVDKISIGKRVENEHQVERFYTTEELTALYKTFNPSPKRTAPLEPSGDTILDTVGAVKNGEAVVMWERHDVKFEHREEFALTSQMRFR